MRAKLRHYSALFRTIYDLQYSVYSLEMLFSY